jgi:hypothetical protein
MGAGPEVWCSGVEPEPPSNGFWSRRKGPAVVAAILGLALAGSVTLALILCAHARHRAETGQARKATVAFVADLRARNYLAAYALLCAQDQSNRAEFQRYWNSQAAAGKAITAFQLLALNVDSRSGEGTAHATLAVHYTNGTSASLTLTLAEHRRVWFPCP